MGSWKHGGVLTMKAKRPRSGSGKIGAQTGDWIGRRKERIDPDCARAHHLSRRCPRRALLLRSGRGAGTVAGVELEGLASRSDRKARKSEDWTGIKIEDRKIGTPKSDKSYQSG
eukprot:4056969-Alexandrium_andersonii.AAC.1